MSYARTFKDLIVYQRQRELAQELFQVSQHFPKEERYSLIDQMRRASRSIGAQIAEAWAKRAYEKHFISKLTDADGELQETNHWIETAFDCGYIGAAEKARLLRLCEEVGRLLGRMKQAANSFCQPSNILHELPTEFYAPHTDN